MSCHLTTELTIRVMTEPMPARPVIEWRELALSTLYRLSAYAVINLIDDAAMLSLVFV
jgi:hypothetical protein